MKKLIILSIGMFLSISANASSWSTNVHVDEFTDESTTMSSVIHDNGIVTLFCSKGDVSIGMTGGAWNYKAKFYTGKLRADKGNPIDISMMASDGRTHYLRDSSEWLKAFKEGSSAVILTKGKNSSDNEVIKISLSNFSKSYEKVKSSCN